MFKKLLVLSITLAACSSIAFAGPSYKGEKPVYKGEILPPPPCFYAGPYVGASFGPRVNNTGAPSAYQGLEGFVSAGWGWMINQDIYLAGEFWVGDSIKLKNYNAAGDGSPRSTWDAGFSVLPGFMLTDTILAFARAGVQRAHFRAQPPDPCNCNSGTTRNGWHVGIGGQSNLCGRWDIRGEYTYQQYTNVTSIGTPRGSVFTLGLIYKFV